MIGLWESTRRALRPRQLRPPSPREGWFLDGRRRTPCTCCAAARARRCRHRRTLCKGSAAAREDNGAAYPFPTQRACAACAYYARGYVNTDGASKRAARSQMVLEIRLVFFISEKPNIIFVAWGSASGHTARARAHCTPQLPQSTVAGSSTTCVPLSKASSRWPCFTSV